MYLTHYTCDPVFMHTLNNRVTSVFVRSPHIISIPHSPKLFYCIHIMNRPMNASNLFAYDDAKTLMCMGTYD